MHHSTADRPEILERRVSPGHQQILDPIDRGGSPDVVGQQRGGREAQNADIRAALPESFQDLIVTGALDPAHPRIEPRGQLREKTGLVEGPIRSTGRLEKSGANGDSQLTRFSDFLDISHPAAGAPASDHRQSSQDHARPGKQPHIHPITVAEARRRGEMVAATNHTESQE